MTMLLPGKLGCRALRSAAIAAAVAGALLSLGVAGAGAAPAVRHLYGLTQGSPGQLVPFDIDAGGHVTERSDQAITAPFGARSFVIGRNAKTIYIGAPDSYDEDDNPVPGVIRTYAVAADGSLSLVGSVSAQPNQLALTPGGSRLFAYLSDGRVSSFQVHADGTLGAQSAATTLGGGGAQSIAISADGKTLYAAVYPSFVEQYAIGANGSLTAQLPTDLSLGPCHSSWVAITPDAKVLDVLCNNPSGGFSFALGSGGGLSQIGSGFTTAGGYNFAEDPLGRAFYIGIYPHWIEQLQRQPDGNLIDFPSAITEPNIVTALAADPTGATLAVSTYPNALRLFTIAADGSLPANPATTIATVPYWYATLLYAPLQPPDAAVSASVSTTGAVTFDASASRGAGPITRYDWAFGDGTSLADAGPAPTHVYPSPGDYTAAVTVRDALGCGTASTFGGQQSYCAGSSAGMSETVVHIAEADAEPAPLRLVQPGEAPSEPPAPRPLAAAATPNTQGNRVLLTWAKPAGDPPPHYLIAWSTLHSAQGPGDPNMHHLRIAGRSTSIVMRTRPRTTLHLAVYAVTADGTYTRATKTTLRLPR